MKMMIGIVILAVLFIVGLVNYNSLVRMRNQCGEALATMDVYLKKRFDLIPNLVSAVKGYAAHEAGTLEQIVRARNGAATPAAQMQADSQLTGALQHLLALSESYPELKANETFVTLQKQLETLETDIAEARKYYNGCVRQYNDKCMTVPSNLVASMFHFEAMPMYELCDSAEWQNVKVEF